MSDFTPLPSTGGMNSDQGQFSPLGMFSGHPPSPEPEMGPQGETGVSGGGSGGVTGPQGVTGPSGGPAGATGVQGVQGPAGVAGPQGIQGPAGPTGVQGPAGPTGIQGIAGITGPQGQTGPSGGPQGATGAQGVQGPAITSLEVVSAGGGSFSTASASFVPIPGTLISFGLLAPATVFLQGFATADPDPVFNVPDAQIGINVDGTDYPGPAAAFSSSGTFLYLPMSATKALALAAGPHTAQLVLRKPGLSPATAAVVETNATIPAVLTLVY